MPPGDQLANVEEIVRRWLDDAHNNDPYMREIAYLLRERLANE